MRDRLADGLLKHVPGTVESGDRARKVAGNCHVCFEGVESEALLFLLEQHAVMASAAASCASGAQDPSHVLAALGIPREVAQGSLRLSLGTTTTPADIDRVLEIIPPAVARLREHGS
jgi:cysteine desulfurase